METPPRPWRALEDPDPEAAAAEERAAGRRARAIGLGAIGTAVLLGLGVVGLVASGGTGSTAVLAGATAEPSPGGSTIVVQVSGAVAHPGLIELPAGARLGDAITAAGGFGPRVDATRIRSLNLAAPLLDGARIVVPSRDDPPDGGDGSTPDTTGAALVDLNHASEAELDALPGIGPVIAGKIIASRSERPFASPDDLVTRKLLGTKTFEKLRALITTR